MKSSFLLTVIVALSFPGIASAAGNDADSRARELVDTLCITCHGTNGVSVVEEFPVLAGQKKTYLIKQLKDFREGNRQDPVMNNMAAPLDDEVIEALGALFSTAPAH